MKFSQRSESGQKLNNVEMQRKSFSNAKKKPKTKQNNTK